MTRDLPSALPAALDIAVLERQLDGTFVSLGDPPDWFEGTLVSQGSAFDLTGTFDALLPFMEDAEAVWRSRDGHAASGTFVEADATGRARPLYARALCIDNRSVLTLGPPIHSLEQTQKLLQRAREEALAMDRTQRRIEEREVLLHCIVHDLSNPLQNLRSSLQFVREDDLEPGEAEEMIELAARQTDRMQEMIREVLSLFKDEVETLMPLASGESADLTLAAQQALEAFAPRAEAAGVHLQLDGTAAPVLVVGEPLRLDRVVGNLLDNALRHSPEGGTITVRVHAGSPMAELVVIFQF
ncbi:MAG: HAMP domain-containing sensor histidine kinase [Bacteroidota bacterium]